jgi:acetolactate synthase I/II/III large subunit
MVCSGVLVEYKCSDIFAQFLKEHQITKVFGIVGAGDAHLFDSISRLGYTEIISVHHEQAAVMAAGAYYRASGRLSAAIVTTGAGSTNAVTGVVSNFMDSIPCLIISGNEKAIHCGSDNPLRIWGVQGYDSVDMVKKVTKYAKLVSEPSEVLYELEKAMHISLEGRPGPCWIDIPMDTQSKNIETSQLKKFSPPKSPDFFPEKSSEDDLEILVSKISEKLKGAKRPLLWLGHGIRLAGAHERLEELFEKWSIPALVTWQGIDMIDSDHPLVFGRAGVYGQRAANFILQNCDYLLAIGTRLAYPQVGYDLKELCRDAEISVVDIDPLELEKFKERFDLRVCADAGSFLEKFIPHGSSNNPSQYSQWISYCQNLRTRYPFIGEEHADTEEFINSYRFMERLNKDLPEKVCVVTDMGTALLSGHQVLKMKKTQRLFTSTGLGEMGYGLPAAMGAAATEDFPQVVCLNCDGGMMMNLQELQTIAHHQLPVKTVIFNNDGYLMIKHTQKNLFKGNYTCTDKKSGVTCPDFKKVGDVFGFPTYRVRTWEDYEEVVPKFFADNRPAFLEVFMDPEQFFHPKLGLAVQEDGGLISPPLEELSPFLSREEVKEAMLIGLHPKSEKIK